MESWIGRARLLREDTKGLWAEFKIDDPKQRPNVDIPGIVYKIRDGQLPALSVSFYPGATELVEMGGKTVKLRTRVSRLDHVALVPEGSYPMLEPLSVRHAPPAKSSADSWREWRETLTMPPSGRT
jgi:phage head maturation protease